MTHSLISTRMGVHGCTHWTHMIQTLDKGWT